MTHIQVFPLLKNSYKSLFFYPKTVTHQINTQKTFKTRLKMSVEGDNNSAVQSYTNCIIKARKKVTFLITA